MKKGQNAITGIRNKPKVKRKVVVGYASHDVELQIRTPRREFQSGTNSSSRTKTMTP